MLHKIIQSRALIIDYLKKQAYSDQASYYKNELYIHTKPQLKNTSIEPRWLKKWKFKIAHSRTLQPAEHVKTYI